MKQESLNKGEIVKCLKTGSTQRNKLNFKIKILTLLNASINFSKEGFLHFIFKGKIKSLKRKINIEENTKLQSDV